jgi:nicotinate-nucleotide pyrophosphorylase (carboxylating)
MPPPDAEHLWRTLPAAQVRAIIETALAEDIGWGDLTTSTTIAPEWTAHATMICKQTGILAGVWLAEQIFRQLDPTLRTTVRVADGQRVQPGQAVLEIAGAVAPILTAERVALNLIQRLSGIATLAYQFVEAVAGLPVRIVDTRKTTPGLRLLEKYAVRVGGAHNHRYNLADAILIKDNHLQAAANAGRSLPEVIRRARTLAPHTVTIEVEVESLEQLRQALDAGADVILLDNMPLEAMREAVAITAGRALLEASGGVTLARVRAIAETGVDLISVGALTHSAPALDISLDVQPHAPPQAV